MWTPQDIFEHKQKWKPKAFTVDVHDDNEWEADRWVKATLMKHRWDKKKYSGPYHHTYLFESLIDAEDFANYLKNHTGDRELKVTSPAEKRKHW